MHLLNFLLVICLPYVSFLNKLIPPDVIPKYFLHPDAAFYAGEFCAILFYWAGYLRNLVMLGKMSERTYFLLSFSALVFMCASKIIFALPYTWIISIFAFGLGVLSVPRGRGVNKITMFLIVVTSLIIFSYSTFILIGMAWFPKDYLQYKFLIDDTLERWF